MPVDQKTENRAFSLVSVPQIRLIELVVIFCIVYMAKEIAGFSYRSAMIISVFLGSAFFTLIIAGVENRVYDSRKSEGEDERVWSWLTVFVDLATVLALIYFTGTVESPFMFLLVIPLFFAGRLLPAMEAGIAVTAVSVLSVLVLGMLEIDGAIRHYSCFPGAGTGALNPNYLSGAVLVLGGFMSLMTYLFSTFYGNFNVYIRTAEDRLITSRKRIIELTRLYDISMGINSIISLETLLKMVAKEITLLMRRPWASVVLTSQKMEIANLVELGANGIVEKKNDTRGGCDALLAEAMKNEDGMMIEDISRDRIASRSHLVSDRGLVSLLAVPIHSGKDVIGALFVSDYEDTPFAEEDLRLLTILSGQVATAIEKSRLYEIMSGRISRLERENEKLDNANKLKMGYISHLSHEFKTPLTAIKAYVESLKDHIDDEEFREKKEFLGVVSDETDRMIRMVNKVLDISKIEFGQRTLKRDVFDLKKAIREVESSMQPYLVDKRLSLVVDIKDNIPLVDGDEDLIKQVFINLIGNAVKFSPQESSIYLTAVEDAVSIKVTVRDEGMGIPEADLKNIFNQFYQVGKDVGDGVGLGLAIVKNIIEQHGGYINVSSVIGEGSAFTFTIPKEHHFNDLVGYLFGAVEAQKEVQELFQITVKVVAQVLSAKIVSLMLLDNEKKELFIKDAYGLDEKIVERARVKLGKGIAGKVAEKGEPLLIENIEEVGITGNPNNPQYETKSLLSVPLIVGTTVIGVINVNNKTNGRTFTEEDLTLLISLGQRISKIIERMRSADDVDAFVKEAVDSLKSMLRICEEDSLGQRKKITGWAVRVGRKLMLSEKEIQVLQYVASIHDVGMTTVSEGILQKTLELTPEEVDEIHKHPQRGAAILRPLEFIELVSQIMLFHHERVDGKGYPMGLKREQIPVGSRVIAVLDAYVSMISKRPFRKQMAVGESIDELVVNCGTQFDPAIVSAFIEVLMDEGQIGIEEYAGIKEKLRYGGKHKALP